MAEDEFEEFAAEDEAPQKKGKGGGLPLGTISLGLNVVVLVLVFLVFTKSGGEKDGGRSITVADVKNAVSETMESMGASGGCTVDLGVDPYRDTPDSHTRAVNADEQGRAMDIIVNTADGKHILAISIAVTIEIPNDRDGKMADDWMLRNSARVLDASISALSQIYIDKEMKMRRIKDKKTDIEEMLNDPEAVVNQGGLRNLLNNYYKSMGLSEIKEVLITNMVTQ